MRFMMTSSRENTLYILKFDTEVLNNLIIWENV